METILNTNICAVDMGKCDIILKWENPKVGNYSYYSTTPGYVGGEYFEATYHKTAWGNIKVTDIPIIVQQAVSRSYLTNQQYIGVNINSDGKIDAWRWEPRPGQYDYDIQKNSIPSNAIVNTLAVKQPGEYSITSLLGLWPENIDNIILPELNEWNVSSVTNIDGIFDNVTKDNFANNILPDLSSWVENWNNAKTHINIKNRMEGYLMSKNLLGNSEAFNPIVITQSNKPNYRGTVWFMSSPSEYVSIDNENSLGSEMGLSSGEFPNITIISGFPVKFTGTLLGGSDFDFVIQDMDGKNILGPPPPNVLGTDNDKVCNKENGCEFTLIWPNPQIGDYIYCSTNHPGAIEGNLIQNQGSAIKGKLIIKAAPTTTVITTQAITTPAITTPAPTTQPPWNEKDGLLITQYGGYGIWNMKATINGEEIFGVVEHDKNPGTFGFPKLTIPEKKTIKIKLNILKTMNHTYYPIYDFVISRWKNQPDLSTLTPEVLRQLRTERKITRAHYDEIEEGTLSLDNTDIFALRKELVSPPVISCCDNQQWSLGPCTGRRVRAERADVKKHITEGNACSQTFTWENPEVGIYSYYSAYNNVSESNPQGVIIVESSPKWESCKKLADEGACSDDGVGGEKSHMKKNCWDSCTNKDKYSSCPKWASGTHYNRLGKEWCTQPEEERLKRCPEHLCKARTTQTGTTQTGTTQAGTTQAGTTLDDPPQTRAIQARVIKCTDQCRSQKSWDIELGWETMDNYSIIISDYIVWKNGTYNKKYNIKCDNIKDKWSYDLLNRDSTFIHRFDTVGVFTITLTENYNGNTSESHHDITVSDIPECCDRNYWIKKIFEKNQTWSGINLSSMNEKENYILIKHFTDNTYLSYDNGDYGYEINDDSNKFKFRIDSIGKGNTDENNKFWKTGDGVNFKEGNYIIYPQTNPDVYLTLWDNYLTIEKQLSKPLIDKQIFSD
jgi:hypothetical protein